MSENIKVRWLTDHEQTKVAPKTLSSQVYNEDGTLFKDTVETAINDVETEAATHASNSDIHVTAAEKEAWNNIEVPSLDGYATEEYVENLYKKLNSNTVLGFYCIEDVTIVTNGISKTYPANSNVEITFIEDDTFEIIPTSDNSILSLTAFPGVLGTFYPWLEGVAQFSNILFNMNDEAMYSKWSQGNQGSYHVQKAQYTNCIFWSDNPYISDVARRTNYTLTHTSQLPLCYSTIPENTFKAFYLAFGVNSDPNWGNQAYKDSFAAATWATQVFSYYGARTIGIVGHDDPDFNIVLPKDCRGLMFDARHIENAGTFDAVNVTNFGAKSGSWREAFGDCISLRRLYIKNLKVSLNISWSPVDYDSISYIISAAANTTAITISVSPYTYNLLSQADFDLAASKNITIALITTNYVEDKRLGQIANKADKDYVDTKVADLVNSAPETLDTLGELATAFAENKEVVEALDTAITNKKDKDLIVTYTEGSTFGVTHSTEEIYEAIQNGTTVYFQKGTELLNLMEITPEYATFFMFYMNMEGKPQQKVVVISNSSIMLDQDDTYNYATTTQLNSYYNKTEVDNLLSSVGPSEDVLLKTEQTLTDEELAQVRSNLKFIGKDVAGQTFTIDGVEVVASANAEIFGDYESNIAVGQWSIAEGSGTVAKGRASHAEGAMTKALSDGSHTEGYQTTATGYWSHAEGEMTTVSSYASHAEGSYCTLPDGTKRYGTASGYASHVEGGGCHTTGSCTHAEGLATTASGAQSHVEGRYTIAAGGAQHVEGIANIEDTEDKYIHIAGNGAFDARSNAHTLDWDGNAWFSGDVYIGSTSGTNKDEGSKKLATEDSIPTKVSQLENDKNYLTAIPSEYVTETELAAKNYLTSFTETDPTVPAWAKAASKPTYTAAEVGADASGSASAVQANLDTHTNNKSNPHGVTLSQLGVTATAAELNYVDGVTSNVQTQLNGKANDFSIEIYNGTGGNPKPVRFASFNYSTCGSENGIAAKISLVSGHGNGTSYAFLQDAIIRVSYLGTVEVDNFKYYGAATGTYDGANRQYGDIFWLVDTTNKIVDFYCLMGQYARMYQTPWKRLTYSTGGAVTQYTSCTVYSSGEKAWANNSDIALMSDIPTVPALSTETWTFTLEDGSTVTKAVYVG